MLSPLLNINNPSSWEIVPLGINCRISHYLRNKGMRKVALPFDWNITPIQSSIELIANDFSGFLDRTNLRFLPPVKRLLFDETESDILITTEMVTPVINTKYEILFPHDFPAEYESTYHIVVDKYQRRIDRLNHLLNSELHIIFVYHQASFNEWQVDQFKQAHLGSTLGSNLNWKETLSVLLQKKFPLLSYSIIDHLDLVGLLGDA